MQLVDYVSVASLVCSWLILAAIAVFWFRKARDYQLEAAAFRWAQNDVAEKYRALWEKLGAAELAAEAGAPGRAELLQALAGTAELEHASERLLLIVLSVSARGGVFRLPTQHLVDLSGLSSSTVNAGLRTLADRGLIVDTGERFGTRRQHRVWRLKWYAPGPGDAEANGQPLPAQEVANAA